MTPAILEISGVSKEYRALRPLRLQQLCVARGDRIAILGLDQAAAEVFINLVTGATLPDEGCIALFGRSTADIVDSADWLASVDLFGIVSERAVLLDQLSVLQNLAMPFTLDIEPPSDEVRGRAERLARDVGLPQSLWNAAVATVDAPDRARIRLGRALALDPAILIADHISAGLTLDAAASFGRDLRQAAAQHRAATVALTADEAFARVVADRVFSWQPATGWLEEKRRRRWFGRVLG